MPISNEVIFSTIHGSRLYGLDHAGSDHDDFIVTTSDREKARHRHTEDYDVVTVGWNSFLNKAILGSHQSLEALFSPFQVWESHFEYQPFVASLRINGSDVFEKYERTIHKFCFGDYKRRRHACRLWLNLRDLRAYGRFNPRLTPEEIDWVSWYCNYEDDELWRYLVG